MDTEQTQRGGLFVFLQLLFRQALSNGDFAFLGWNDLKGWIFFETRFFFCKSQVMLGYETFCLRHILSTFISST